MKNLTRIVLILALILNPILSLWNLHEIHQLNNKNIIDNTTKDELVEENSLDELIEEDSFNNESESSTDDTYMMELYQYSSRDQQIVFTDDGQYRDTTNSIKVMFQTAETKHETVENKCIYIYLDDIYRIKSEKVDKNTVKIYTTLHDYLLVFGDDMENTFYKDKYENYDIIIFNPIFDIDYDKDFFLNNRVVLEATTWDLASNVNKEEFYGDLPELFLYHSDESAVETIFRFQSSTNQNENRIFNNIFTNFDGAGDDVLVIQDNKSKNFIFRYIDYENQVCVIIPQGSTWNYGWSWREFESFSITFDTIS